MAKQEGKKEQPKNGKVHKMTQEKRLPSNPEEHSMDRIVRLTNSLFSTINQHAETIKEEGNGEMNVTEVTQVLIQMAYNYNGRNLKFEVEEKMKEFNQKK